MMGTVYPDALLMHCSGIALEIPLDVKYNENFFPFCFFRCHLERSCGTGYILSFTFNFLFYRVVCKLAEHRVKHKYTVTMAAEIVGQKYCYSNPSSSPRRMPLQRSLRFLRPPSITMCYCLLQYYVC